MRRFVWIGMLAGALVFALAPPAEAHALVRTSSPPNGAVLSKPPSRVVITFTEPPDPKLSFVKVLNSAGRDVERGSSTAVPGRPEQLQVPLQPNLPNGVYTITWRTVSRVDGHVTGGSLTFGVGESPKLGVTYGPSIPTTPAPSPLAVAGRWAFYWGLALMVGAGVYAAAVDRSGLPGGGRALLIVAWALAALGLVMMVVAERITVGVSFGTLLGSQAGHEFVYRGIALVVLGAAVFQAVVNPRWTSVVWVAVAAAGAMLAHVLAGHAGAVSAPAPRWFDVMVQWMHLVAVGVWIGGLAWLLLAIRRSAGPDRAAAVRRFSFLAGFALLVVAITGSIRALSELGWRHAVHGLLHTSFGLTLAIKVALFLVLVALGARNRYTNVPAVDRVPSRIGQLRRTVRAEIVVAAAILVTTGVLSSFPPASSLASPVRRAVGTQQIVVAGSDFATTVRVRLSVTPGTVGPNRFEARVTDFDTGRPVPARAVSLNLSLPSAPNVGNPTVPLKRSGPGTWTASATTLSMYGTWNVDVLVQESTGSVTVPLQITPRLPPEKIQVTTASGQPTLYTIALPGGNSVQTYVDPGSAGKNSVHFTFFTSSGNELPISSATGSSASPGGSVQSMPLLRLDRGHFVANTTLEAGRWRFLIQATTKQGAVYTAYFDQPITS
jgi:copper transport protein